MLKSSSAVSRVQWRKTTEKFRMSFQSQRWINDIFTKWRQCAFLIELKDIYLNHAKHKNASYQTQDVTLVPNVLSSTSVGSSSIRCWFSSAVLQWAEPGQAHLFTLKMEATFTQLGTKGGAVQLGCFSGDVRPPDPNERFLQRGRSAGWRQWASDTSGGPVAGGAKGDN